MRDTHQGLRKPAAARPYYEDLNRATDFLVRCQGCNALVQVSALHRTGLTPCCGTKRVREIRQLTIWEWLKIRLGVIRFPYRQAFLREFGRAR